MGRKDGIVWNISRANVEMVDLILAEVSLALGF